MFFTIEQMKKLFVLHASYLGAYNKHHNELIKVITKKSIIGPQPFL